MRINAKIMLLVAGTNEAFAQVTDSASRVGELVAEIAAASEEQARIIKLG